MVKWALELTKWNQVLRVNFNFCYWSRFNLCVIFRMALSAAHMLGLQAQARGFWIKLDCWQEKALTDTLILTQNYGCYHKIWNMRACGLLALWLENLSPREATAHVLPFLHVSSLVSCVTPYTNFVLLGRLQR